MMCGIVVPTHYSPVVIADMTFLQAVQWKIFSLRLESTIKRIQRVFSSDRPHKRLLRAIRHALRHAIL